MYIFFIKKVFLLHNARFFLNKTRFLTEFCDHKTNFFIAYKFFQSLLTLPSRAESVGSLKLAKLWGLSWRYVDNVYLYYHDELGFAIQEFELKL